MELSFETSLLKTKLSTEDAGTKRSSPPPCLSPPQSAFPLTDQFASGWKCLITSMLYENSLSNSKWRPYLDLLPESTTTPLYWNEEDRKSLKGTSLDNRFGTLVGHIICHGPYSLPLFLGEQEIVLSYNSDVVPLMKKYPEVFKEEKFFTLEQFKRMASIVMAYSFTDEETNEVSLMPMAGTTNTAHYFV